MSNYESFDIHNASVEESKDSVLTKIFSKIKNKGDRGRNHELEQERLENVNYGLDNNMSLTRIVKKVKKNLSFNENVNYQNKTNRVYWMPDSVCLNCYLCDGEFTYYLRKHHCRMCGQIFCYRCCNYELPGMLWKLRKPQKSCRKCFESYYQRQLHNRPTGQHATTTGDPGMPSTSILTFSSSGLSSLSRRNNPQGNNVPNRTSPIQTTPPRAKFSIGSSSQDLPRTSNKNSTTEEPDVERRISTKLSDTNSVKSQSKTVSTSSLSSESIVNLLLNNNVPSGNMQRRISSSHQNLNSLVPDDMYDFRGIHDDCESDVGDDDDDDDDSRYDVENDMKYFGPSYYPYSRSFLKRTNSLPKNLNKKKIKKSNNSKEIMKQKSILRKTQGKSRFPTNSKQNILQPICYLKDELLTGLTGEKESKQVSSINKSILLSVWNLIITETKSIKTKYESFQNGLQESADQFKTITNELELNDADDVTDTLDIIIKDDERTSAVITGNNLVNWLLKQTTLINSRLQAVGLCQYYLEMRLLNQYFSEDSIFKDDQTLYVIEEVITEFSPSVFSNEAENFFPESEDSNAFISVTGSVAKSQSGNSVFYNSQQSTSNKENPSDSDKFNISLLKIKTPSPATLTCANGNWSASGQSSMVTILRMRSCEYLEQLLKQELRDYNLDCKWVNILLPVCKLISETITLNNPYNSSNNDIRNLVQIKKIPSLNGPDCRILYSICMSKNTTFPLNKELKNPSILLVRSSIDYCRQKKLQSLEPLILQEEEFIRNCVRKITKLHPDIIVVEGTVSLLAKDMLEKCGLVIISNVRREQMMRLSKILQTKIIDSVDSLGANIDLKLGKCKEVFCHNYKLCNGRSKNIIYFSLTNLHLACTVTLHSSSLSELVLVKYIFRYMLLAFKNAYLEVNCFKDLQFRCVDNKSVLTSYVANHKQESSSVYLDIISNRLLSVSANVKYEAPPSVLRSVDNPELQDKLLAHPINQLSPNDRISEVIKHKHRHVLAELYDQSRMETRKHPHLLTPDINHWTNCLHSTSTNRPSTPAEIDINKRYRCIKYADYKIRGSRFALQNYQKDLNWNLYDVNSKENGKTVAKEDLSSEFISTISFYRSDMAIKMGFLTRNQEKRWKSCERKAFDSVADRFNPRNYLEFWYTYYVKSSAGYCINPKIRSLRYYEKSDIILGKYLDTMLDEKFLVCDCSASEFDHIFSYVHGTACILISIHPIDPSCYENSLQSTIINATAADQPNSPQKSGNSLNLSVWNWCTRCDKTQGIQQLSEETLRFSFGRFLDLLFNLNISETGLLPSQCNHSLKTDFIFYFMKKDSKRVLEIRYTPINVFEFQSPDLFIDIPKLTVPDNKKYEVFQALKSDVYQLSEIKMKCNLEIKEKISQLKKAHGPNDSSDIFDFLQKESDSEEYSCKMNELHNLIESISTKNTSFDIAIFDNHEMYLREEIIRVWQDISAFLLKWDVKLHEAYENEKKAKPVSTRTADELLSDVSDTPISKSATIPIQIANASPVNTTESSIETKTSRLSSSTSVARTDKDDYINTMVKKSLSSNLLEQPDDRKNKSEDNLTSFTEEKSTKCPGMSIGPHLMPPKNHPVSSSTTSSGDVKLTAPSPQATGTMGATNNLRKFFLNFLNSSGSLKILTDRTPADKSFVFQEVQSEIIPVIVSDNSLTSAVAYVLSCDQYQNFLRPKREKEKSTTLAITTSPKVLLSPLGSDANNVNCSPSCSSPIITSSKLHRNISANILCNSSNTDKEFYNSTTICTGSSDSGTVLIDSNTIQQFTGSDRKEVLPIEADNQLESSPNYSLTKPISASMLSSDDNLESSSDKNRKEDIRVHYKRKSNYDNEAVTDDSNDVQLFSQAQVDNPESSVDGVSSRFANKFLDSGQNKSKANNKTADFEITLQNHKVKCTVKVFYAKLFHELRQKLIKDEKSFIMSLAQSKSWTTTGGKSGLSFTKTIDNRFITKELSGSESNAFKRFHMNYFNYMDKKIVDKDKCILAKILGVYQIEYNNNLTKQSTKSEFLVMENVFYKNNPRRKFDLKGKMNRAMGQVANTNSSFYNNTGNNNITQNSVNPAVSSSNFVNAEPSNNTAGSSSNPPQSQNNANSNTTVLQDKDFINCTQNIPIFVSWQTQLSLIKTLINDTDYLLSMPVMDYSLLIGLEEQLLNRVCHYQNNITTMGIIDYLRMFTVDKLIEMHLKKSINSQGLLPTVIEPGNYQKRFLGAMQRYFIVAPSSFDPLLPWSERGVTVEDLFSKRDEQNNKSANARANDESASPKQRRKLVAKQHSPEAVSIGNIHNNNNNECSGIKLFNNKPTIHINRSTSAGDTHNFQGN